MNKEFLAEYKKSEFERATALAADPSSKNDAPVLRLKRLYGMPVDRKAIYAESGGLANIDCFPPDVTLVLPIFPWSEEELVKHVGPRKTLERLIESGRVLPVIQEPERYEPYPHLDFVFKAGAPSYFIRGAFASAVQLGLDPVVEDTGMWGFLLRDIYELMKHCAAEHKTC